MRFLLNVETLPFLQDLSKSSECANLFPEYGFKRQLCTHVMTIRVEKRKTWIV